MLGSIGEFLKDHAVILGSMAALVAIVGGLWKGVAFFVKKSEKSGPTTAVTAGSWRAAILRTAA